ncbi:MAG TPA: hypothetical protein VN700_07835 [Vicinamibacterales bacterium]|nr:hypothetical protein [Vicinamibacterales bacterium]
MKECFILGNLDDVGFEGLPESAEALDKLSGCYVAVTHEPANPSIDEYLDSPVRIGRLPHQIDEPARVGFRVAGKLQRQGYLEREPPVALWSVDVAVDSDVGPPGMSLRPGHTIEPLFREPATSNGGFDDDSVNRRLVFLGPVDSSNNRVHLEIGRHGARAPYRSSEWVVDVEAIRRSRLN